MNFLFCATRHYIFMTNSTEELSGWIEGPWHCDRHSASKVSVDPIQTCFVFLPAWDYQARNHQKSRRVSIGIWSHLFLRCLKNENQGDLTLHKSTGQSFFKQYNEDFNSYENWIQTKYIHVYNKIFIYRHYFWFFILLCKKNVPITKVY